MNSVNWCFTLNNYTAEDEQKLSEVQCRYIKYGREVGESGTPHLQGFIIMERKSRLSAMKKVHEKCHWEAMKGSVKDNDRYCEKEGNWIERGDRPKSKTEVGQDEKIRWREIIQLAEEGNWDELKEKYPKESVLYDRNLERISKKRKTVTIIDGEMEHEWIVGPPRTGKSRMAREENPTAYIKDPTSRWWDGYENQQVVIIDDFDKYQKAQGGDLKRWLDRYPFEAEFKGGMHLIRPRKIVVTSNYRPDVIWDDPITVEAISERVKFRPLGEVFTPFAQCFK